MSIRDYRSEVYTLGAFRLKLDFDRGIESH